MKSMTKPFATQRFDADHPADYVMSHFYRSETAAILCLDGRSHIKTNNLSNSHEYKHLL